MNKLTIGRILIAKKIIFFDVYHISPNRAAAHIKLDNLDSAVTDCKKALSLNPNYARAYGRLG